MERKETAILGLVESVLKESRLRAHSSEAQDLIEQAIARVATISATQGYLYDPDGATRINGWDLLSAICVTAQMPVQDRVEIDCECDAGDLASETAMPLMLIAKELIANAARHGLGGRSRVRVQVSLRREFGEYVFTVQDDGPGLSLQDANLHCSGLVPMLVRQLNGTFDVKSGPGARCVVRFPDPRILN
jgi:two-component sensor histidine kinase